MKPSEKIDQLIAGITDWRGKTFAAVRKGKVKVTFAHGAHLADPGKLFNAGLGGNERREIDIFEGDKVDAPALKNLVRAAIEYNQTKLKKNAPAKAKTAKKKKT